MKKILTLAALVGVTGAGVANAVEATLTGVTSQSSNGVATWTITSGGTGWDLDTATGVATQGAGTLSMVSKVGKSTLMTHEFTGAVLSSGPATGSSWNCIPGTFLTVVNICGNYNYGGDLSDESTYTAGVASSTVVLNSNPKPAGPPGDDFFASGGADGAQSMANSYSTLAKAQVNATTWTLSNAIELTSGYTFTFTVAADALPTIADDVIETFENTASAAFDPTITLGDGTDVQHTLAVTTDGTNGSCVVTPGDATGTVVYTPNAAFTGADSCVLTITDTDSDTDTATLSITVNPLGANPDSASTTRGQPVVISPGLNDEGFDNTIAVSLANGGVCTEGGTAEVTAGQNGAADDIRITYTPAAITAGTSGSPVYTDVCNYSLDDGVAPADDADISIAVSNSVPAAVGGSASAAISTLGVSPGGQTATFTAPGTGGNLGNAPIQSIVPTDPAHGTASVAGNVITYTLDAGDFFTGSDTFTYTITDLDGETSTSANVTVTITDVEPVIADGAITTDADTASDPFAPTISLAGNGALTDHELEVTTDGANGSCTLSAPNATGTLTYTPDTGYTGDDSCVLTLTDGDGDSDTATISITVNDNAITLPGGSSSMDLWSLSLLGSLPLLMRRRRRS
jgi:hypothetical protein